MAALLALAGACSSGGDSAGDAGSADDEMTAGEAAAALGDTDIPPEPDHATAAAYIAALDAIHPGIDRDDPESAIDRGRNQCSSIRNTPDDRATLIDLTNQRFTSPEQPDGWGPATAEQILDVVHTHLCPAY